METVYQYNYAKTFSQADRRNHYLNNRICPEDRSIPMHPKLKQALFANQQAKRVFDQLSSSRQKEIIRYISFLKTEESVERNISRAIGFLLEKERFVGRDSPFS